MPILNYTTKIRPDHSVNEIQKILGEGGAQRVSVDYAAGKITAVMFALDVSGTLIHFRLPANPDGVLAVLKRQRVSSTYQTRDHAEAVAWRIVKDWVEAQLALVAAQQAQLAEVFLPYAMVNSTETAFTAFQRQAARGLITGDVEDAN